MKENWIEDVLIDLSKSAFNEGRLDLCMAIDDFVKIAGASSHWTQKVDNEIEDFEACDGDTGRPKADILYLHEYRKNLRIRAT